MSGRGVQAAGLMLFPLIAFAAFREVRDWRSARTEREIAQRAVRPIAVVAEDRVALAAPNPDAARRALVQLLADRASAAGVRLATAAVGADPAGHFAATEFVAVGGEAAVLHFTAALESARPIVRLDRWQLTPTSDGLRLAGRAEALWQGGDALRTASAGTIHVPAPAPAAPAPTGLFAPTAVGKVGSGFPAELIGIVGRIAVDPQAMLRLANGTARTLAIGETVEGWKLAEISADRVRFRRGSEERVLVLPTAAE